MRPSRMDEYSVAIDPDTGELRQAGAPRRWNWQQWQGASPWRPLAIGAGFVLAILIVVFATALLMEFF
jgi:hypothetical protein